MTLRQLQRVARGYGMYVKKSRSKWGMLYRVGFIGGEKADSVGVRTLQDALEIVIYISRKRI